MQLLKSLFSKKEEVHIEVDPVQIGDERISLIPLKTVIVSCLDHKYKIEKEIMIPAFSSIRVCCLCGESLSGFREAYLLAEPSEKILISTDFLDKCCVDKYSKIKFQNKYWCYIGFYNFNSMNNYCDNLFTQIKSIFSAIFLTFEEEAVNAFKVGIIDVFLNMINQLNACKDITEKEHILNEVYGYLFKLFDVLVEMDAQKQIFVKDVFVALKLKEETENAKEVARVHSQNSFLQELSARKELLDYFNAPLQV